MSNLGIDHYRYYRLVGFVIMFLMAQRIISLFFVGTRSVVTPPSLMNKKIFFFFNKYLLLFVWALFDFDQRYFTVQSGNFKSHSNGTNDENDRR